MYAAAAQQEAKELLGVAARYNKGKTVLRSGQFATSRAELARRLRVEAKQRCKLRVSLRWVQKKGRDIAREMRDEGNVFKCDHSLPACSDKWAWTWLTANGYRIRRGKWKRWTPIPVEPAMMTRWWSVVRELVVSQGDRFGRPVRMVNIDERASLSFRCLVLRLPMRTSATVRGAVDLSLPNPSMRMRMATLQVLLCNDPSVLPCPPTIIFDG